MTTNSWINKKVLAWASYDFANQAFQALFITLLFPIFLMRLGGNELLVGLIGGGSALLAAALVPFIGAFSDTTGKRLPILLYAAIATSVLVILVGFVGFFFVPVLAFLAKVTDSVAKSVYDAKMIDAATPDKYGRLSGVGNALSYTGTILSLVAAVPIFIYFGWNSLEAIQATFILIAVWYLIFLVPIMVFVPDQVYRETQPIRKAIKDAWLRVLETIKNLSKIQSLGRFLAASFFYSNGLNAIVFFLGLFSQQVVGLTLAQFFPVFALTALTAGIGAFVSGRISDLPAPAGAQKAGGQAGRIGPVKVIRVCLIAWLALFAILLYQVTFPIFLAVGVIGGFFFGAIWTMNRHMIANITPPAEIAKIFGFEGLASRFSAILGPIIFGALVYFQNDILSFLFPISPNNFEGFLSVYLHPYTLAITAMIILLLAGLFILRKLK